ncbi:MAG: aconitate decarboxylase [Acidimicrobiaceae bacterium]|jgi:2-methylcitrate dehydratase PrpD|nr:aconitate decarboxylase [Acidimicrobiaceae bacterium]
MTNHTTDTTTAVEGTTARLASWLSGFRGDQAPAEVIERAKLLILDGLGCALVGAQLPWSRTAVEAVTGFEGRGDVPIIGWGRTAGGPAAAVLNSTFIQGFELDDFHPLAPLHSASLILPALLSSAHEDSSVDGARFLSAAIAGFEVGPRVGLALHGAQMLSRGWHSGPVFGSIAAAAAVANLLGLNATATEDALGLGATQAGGLMAAQFGAASKRMQHGFAARNGLYAALLARSGYTGIKAVFEQPYGGFLSTFGEGHDPDATQIDSELGERWETQRIAIKPYAAMGGLHAAIDEVFDISADRPLAISEIEAIEVELGHAVYQHGWWPPQRPLTPTAAQMNVAYSVAVAVLDGAALIDQYSPARIDADDVWQLLPRITAHHQSDFDAQPLGRGQTRVRVRFTDGQVLESYQFAAKSILHPLDFEAVVSKYETLTRRVIDPDRQQEIKDAVLALDTAPDLTHLVGLLVDPVASPFEADSGGT